MKKLKYRQLGFTLLEIIVSITLFTIIILLVSEIYLVTQRAYNKNSDTAELTQNARVSLDRITRELRQSANIITSLPPTDTDPGNPPVNQIYFQDGHDISRITYLRYYLNGSNLMREYKAYYFDEEPAVYVAYNALDQNNEPPEEIIIDSLTVGEFFTELEFWGANGLINISLGLNKNQHNFNLETSIYSRNQ